MTPQEFVKYYFGDPAKNGFGIPFSIGFQEMVEMLEEYDSHKWISVDERLPELDEDVLCVDADFDDVRIGHRSNLKTGSGKCMFWFSEDDWIPATHWHPLPKPPKQ